MMTLMTLQQLFNHIADNPLVVIVFFIMLPLAALAVNALTSKSEDIDIWKYVYSAMVFMACIPGIFAITLLAYSFMFLRQSLLQVNLIVYFLPIISMVATLFIINQRVLLKNVPGFRKITGLIMLLFVTFIAMFIIDRTRIFVLVHANIWQIVMLFVGLFLVFRLALWYIFYRNESPSSSQSGSDHELFKN